MRRISLAALAAMAVATAACGSDSDGTANEAAPAALDSNLLLDEPANDASALESVADSPEPAPMPPPLPDSGNTATQSPAPLGETRGGDTGGNVIESNVTTQ